jgi:hypothetical protein
MIEKAKRTKAGVFVCFVDFKKAFDTIWRKGLYFKLLKMGLSTKFKNVIKDMYTETQSCIKIPDQPVVTRPIISTIGTRQGCNLSPALFNIFINDLPDVIKNFNADPVSLGKYMCNILMYADDLVLCSRTADGLQRCLDCIFNYCKKWRLRVNLDKTKIIVFNKRVVPTRIFKYGTEQVEIVNEYVYLGLKITKSGSFTSGVRHLSTKGSKCLMAIMKTCKSDYGTDARYLIKLFDTAIKPILLYSSEVYGMFDWKHTLPGKNAKYGFEQYLYGCIRPWEAVHLKCCKQILRVNRYANNLAVRGELGRYPLSISVLSAVLNYWKHVQSAPPDSLIFQTYKDEVSLHEIGKSPLIDKMSTLLQYLHDNKTMSATGEIDVTCVLERLKCKYQNHFFETLHKDDIDLHNHSQLRLYKQFKKIYAPEPYMDKVINPKHRRVLTMFRISAHRLPIQTGRREGIPLNQRVCKICSLGKLGDELHYITECQNNKIVAERSAFMIKCHGLIRESVLMEPKLFAVYLLKGSDRDLTIWFAKFLYNIYEIFINTTQSNQ